MAYSILIVDDSGLTRSVIRRTLVVSGIETTRIQEATNGIQALAALMNDPIDLVLLDLNMPGMGGRELVRKMRTNLRLASVPVIIVSSESTEGRVEELKALGAQGYVKKPFSPEQIKAAVEEVLGVTHV